MRNIIFQRNAAITKVNEKKIRNCESLHQAFYVYVNAKGKLIRETALKHCPERVAICSETLIRL